MAIDFSGFSQLYYQIGLTGIVIVLFFTGRIIIRKFIHLRARKRNFSASRADFTIKFFSSGWAFIVLLVLLIIWGFSLKGLSIYFASLFTLIGVAFFAQWSLLSNITAAIILFFNYSYKVGNRIRVLDGDNSITGEIIDIQPFYFIILTDNGDKASYPNNLILQKPILQLQEKNLASEDGFSEDGVNQHI